ncbi:MAG: hypothetical protein Q4C73_03985 [Eubacteriales bacterium]|nr:hypothetical protein [Eubacteriales bacterium]
MLTKRNCPEIGLAAIYRTVQALVGLHVIDRESSEDGRDKNIRVHRTCAAKRK